MKARTAARPCSRPRGGLKVPFRPGLDTVRLGQGMLGIGLSPERGCCFAPSQILSIRGVTQQGRLPALSLLGWPGWNCGFLASPHLRCTAATRGKNDHHRGAFPHTSGEIYFCWPEFWTRANRGTGGLVFPMAVWVDPTPSEAQAPRTDLVNCCA
jgi:hypothetical protein